MHPSCLASALVVALPMRVAKSEPSRLFVGVGTTRDPSRLLFVQMRSCVVLSVCCFAENAKHIHLVRRVPRASLHASRSLFCPEIFPRASRDVRHATRMIAGKSHARIYKIGPKKRMQMGMTPVSYETNSKRVWTSGADSYCLSRHFFARSFRGCCLIIAPCVGSAARLKRAIRLSRSH